MKLSRFIMAVVLTLGISGARAQEVIVKAELDTNRALIGDQIKLRLLIDKPAGLQVGFPVLKDTITGKIEIIGNSSIDTISNASGRTLLSRELLISVFDTGQFEIPSLAFTLQSNGVQNTLNTIPVTFEILAVRADSTIRDIKAVYKAPLSLAEIMAYIKEDYPYGLMAIAAALIIWFIVRYFRRRKGHGKIITREIPVELPEVTALRELEKLKDEKPWLHNKVKMYHIRVSEILRTYIENRFKVMALEQTTDEILMSLKPPLCKPSDHNRLSSVLKLADLVKFAKVIPDVGENAAQVDLAEEFIHDTTVHEEPATQDSVTEEAMVQSNRSS